MKFIDWIVEEPNEVILRLALPVFVLLVALSGWVSHTTAEWVHEVEIVKTERVNTKDSSRYLVFSTNEVFQNRDSIWHLKFDSSDIYGGLQAGMTCDFRVNGFRVRFLSAYRNILEVRCG